MKIFTSATAFVLSGFVFVFLAIGISLPSISEIPLKPGDKFVNVRGSRMRYRISDKGGRPVIFLHGFGQDLTTWEPLLKVLSCGRAFIVDLIGFGLSGRPEITYDLETHSQYLLEFMDRLGVNSAILIGTSMGGSIALWTAAHSPKRVDAVAVFAPSAYPGSMRHGWPGNLFYRPNAFNRIAHFFVNNRPYKWLFPRSLALQAIDVTASYDQTFMDALREIRQPVLLVWSQSDSRVPYSYSSSYKEILTQAHFIEAPVEAGHGAARYPTPEIIEWLCSVINKVP